MNRSQPQRSTWCWPGWRPKSPARGKSRTRTPLRSVAAERAIDTKLLAQEARRQSMELKEGRLEAVLAKIEQQVGGHETLVGNLATIGLTFDKLKQNIAEAELAQQFLEARISPGIKVSDEEVQEFYTSNPDMFKTPDEVHARHILMTSGAGRDR